jgi:hypothetical protein
MDELAAAHCNHRTSTQRTGAPRRKFILANNSASRGGAPPRPPFTGLAAEVRICNPPAAPPTNRSPGDGIDLSLVPLHALSDRSLE